MKLSREDTMATNVASAPRLIYPGRALLYSFFGRARPLGYKSPCTKPNRAEKRSRTSRNTRAFGLR